VAKFFFGNNEIKGLAGKACDDKIVEHACSFKSINEHAV